ncbi:MAG: PadR family transcriptional regulator [Clostridia bacterium]|nr:PadR family transcriptional regulator [Clostridia bacterium]
MGIRDNFKKGSVEMLLLTLLREEDMYGYQLSQEIKERSEGIITIPEGSMYPTLYRLEQNGYVTSCKKTVGSRLSRIYYHIEEKGIERLQTMWSEYHVFNDALLKVRSISDSVIEKN